MLLLLLWLFILGLNTKLLFRPRMSQTFVGFTPSIRKTIILSHYMVVQNLKYEQGHIASVTYDGSSQNYTEAVASVIPKIQNLPYASLIECILETTKGTMFFDMSIDRVKRVVIERLGQPLIFIENSGLNATNAANAANPIVDDCSICIDLSDIIKQSERVSLRLRDSETSWVYILGCGCITLFAVVSMISSRSGSATTSSDLTLLRL